MRQVISQYLIIVTFAIFICAPPILFAQEGTKDILYLKNGSVIKGYVLEQIPNKTVRFQTSDGSIFVFRMDEVERIAKEQPEIFKEVPKKNQQVLTTDESSQFQLPGGLAILGGVSLPTGDFAATSGEKAGYAKLGYSITIEYFKIDGNSLMYAIGFSYSSNPMDESAVRQSLGVPSSVSSNVGSWTSFAPYLTFGFGGISGNIHPFIGGILGISFASSPDISFSGGGNSISQASSSATAVCYGIAAGLTTVTEIHVSLRYLASTPKYSVTASGGTSSASSEFEQPSNLFQAVVGIGF